MNRRVVSWAGIVVLVVALAAGVRFAWQHRANAIAVTKEYDMVQMLREIEHANDEIGKVNEGIRLSLEQVQSEAVRIDAVRIRLGALQAGLQEQRRVLGELRSMTADQAGLSRQLLDQTAAILPHTEAIATTAQVEADLLIGMGTTTRSLGSGLNEVVQINGGLQQKLSRVEELTGDILQSLP